MTPSNANTSGLEPCPFCGGEAWLNDYEAKYSDLPPKSRCPQCQSCGASLGYLATPAKATEAWNRRVTAASAQAEREARLAAEARADRLAGVEDCLNDRAEACLSIVATAGDDPSKARVASKAQAYFHAAELVRAALQQEG